MRGFAHSLDRAWLTLGCCVVGREVGARLSRVAWCIMLPQIRPKEPEAFEVPYD